MSFLIPISSCTNSPINNNVIILCNNIPYVVLISDDLIQLINSCNLLSLNESNECISIHQSNKSTITSISKYIIINHSNLSLYTLNQSLNHQLYISNRVQVMCSVSDYFITCTRLQLDLYHLISDNVSDNVVSDEEWDDESLPTINV